MTDRYRVLKNFSFPVKGSKLDRLSVEDLFLLLV